MSTTTDILPLCETTEPTDPADVVSAVRAAVRDAVPIYPIGGGTGLEYGGRPSVPGVGLNLGKLRRVIDYPADDMTITVEAGMTVAELAKKLAAKRQRLPVDVADAGRATVGGLIAVDPCGPRQLAYGTIRDYVIGVRAVDGVGKEFSAGGRVAKNTAGYDLCKLLAGTLGTLGVMTEATLAVRPMPESTALVACEACDWDAVERLLAALVHTRSVPVAVELLTGPEEPPCPALGPMLQSSVARLIVGFEGTVADVDWMVKQIHKEWRTEDAVAPVTVSTKKTNSLWKWLSDLSADAAIHIRPSAVVVMARHVRALDGQCSIQVHAGVGIVRVRWSPAERSEEVSRYVDLREMVARAGGTVTLLAVPEGMPATAENVWGPPRGAAAVMRALKERFDPRGLLNPGRLDYR